MKLKVAWLVFLAVWCLPVGSQAVDQRDTDQGVQDNFVFATYLLVAGEVNALENASDEKVGLFSNDLLRLFLTEIRPSFNPARQALGEAAEGQGKPFSLGAYFLQWFQARRAHFNTRFSAGVSPRGNIRPEEVLPYLLTRNGDEEVKHATSVMGFVIETFKRSAKMLAEDRNMSEVFFRGQPPSRVALAEGILRALLLPLPLSKEPVDDSASGQLRRQFLIEIANMAGNEPRMMWEAAVQIREIRKQKTQQRIAASLEGGNLSLALTLTEWMRDTSAESLARQFSARPAPSWGTGKTVCAVLLALPVASAATVYTVERVAAFVQALGW